MRKFIKQVLFWSGVFVILLGYAVRPIGGEIPSNILLIIGLGMMATAEAVRTINITRSIDLRGHGQQLVPVLASKRRHHWSHQLKRR